MSLAANVSAPEPKLLRWAIYNHKKERMKNSFTMTKLLCMMAFIGCCVALPAQALNHTIYSNNFESYTTVATGPTDTSDADPEGTEWNASDDTALAPTVAGAGVQVISWLTNAAGGATKSLLLNPSSEAQLNLPDTRSGTKYIIEFDALVARTASSTKSFYIIVQGEGADYNGSDFMAYCTDRVLGSMKLRAYDGTKSPPGWILSAVAPDGTKWQHHKIEVDPILLKTTVYVDDMVTPILEFNGIARSEVAMPTRIILRNEAGVAADGWWAIDDFSIRVENCIDLSTTWTEGFESYTARADIADDADPQGSWIVTETDGTAGGGGRPLAPGKVQVVDTEARTGTKSLKLEGGHRAGATIAWGVAPQSDVQITWWAKVPASVQGTEATYLRFSLYGAEGNNTYSGDSALLGYGSRNTTVGDATSLTYYTSTWFDTGVDYTPGEWEEYQLTTHCSQGRYTIVKNPSRPDASVVVDRSAFIGSAATWGPMFMAAWSSSNVTNHPPVYVDDITIKSLVSNPQPVETPYTAQIDGSRFTNYTMLNLGGPIGATAIDPRDNSTIVFAVDAVSPGGSINVARKVASGNWAVDPAPLVAGISNPSGLAIAADGTLWWTHDFTTALMRLKWPWTSNVPELIVQDFGVLDVNGVFVDDDPFDLCLAPSGFSGSIGSPSDVIIMDRGVDGNDNNVIFVVPSGTTELGQTNVNSFLVGPVPPALGGSDLTALAAISTTEVATLCGTDGQITAVDANGITRQIWPSFYRDPSVLISLSGLTVDPTTGKLWIADDLTDTIWSCEPLYGDDSQQEISFPLIDPTRPDRQFDFQEPGLKFSPNGGFLVASDTSIANGGGRLIIFHNEAFALPSFKITSYNRTPTNFELSWESAGAAKYDVFRGTDLANPASFVQVATNLSLTTFTDTVSAGAVFYRVVAKP